MCTKDLKGWLHEAKREKDPEDRRWEIVVRLVQVMLRDGNVLEEIAWVTMFLLLKGKESYRGIGIVEVLCKVCSVVVNFSLKKSVVLYGALRGFREVRGAGAATSEAKLAQKLAILAHDPLFQVFLYVYKAYDSLDREH